MKKIIAIGVCVLLTGCYQSSTSFIGPAYTLGASGNIYQAGLTFGLNETLEKTTGKTTIEHTKKFLDKAKKYKEKTSNKVFEYKKNTEKTIDDIKIDSQDFIALVKSNIEKTRGNLLD